MWRLSLNLGTSASWNIQALSRPVTGTAVPSPSFTNLNHTAFTNTVLIQNVQHGVTVLSMPGLPDYREFTIIIRTPLDEWSARRSDLHVTTCNNSQETDIHTPVGIRTNNPSKRAAAYPRLRPRGYWDRHVYNYLSICFNSIDYCRKTERCVCVCVCVCVGARAYQLKFCR